MLRTHSISWIAIKQSNLIYKIRAAFLKIGGENGYSFGEILQESDK